MVLRRTAWVALAILGLAVTSYAARDIDYVDGLVARGYLDLALEHLQEMAGRPDVSAEEKLLIPLKLGRVYSEMAGRETDAAQRQKDLDLALKHLNEFVGKNPTHPQILDVRLQKIDMTVSRAQAEERVLAATTDAAKKAEILKGIEQLYKDGITDARAVASEAGQKAKEIKKNLSATSSKAEQEKFWIYYGAQVRGMFLAGHLEFLSGMMYPAKDDGRKKHLAAAMAQFDLVLKERPQTNVTFEAYVRRGVCMRELAPFEAKAEDVDRKRREALQMFESALAVQRNPQTIRTRADAFYQKAVTAMLVGDYDAVVSSAEGFLRENPEGSASYQGQEVVLMKAQALGEIAKKLRNEKKDTNEWEIAWHDASRAIRDILPDYPTIRERADRLLQEWAKVFPAEDVVISPFVAAAQAKKLFDEKKYNEAISKYREVITLSAGRRQYADFAQEAWRNIGVAYYQTGRLYQADIAWRELLSRFPEAFEGVELAWYRTRIYAYLYAQQSDRSDLDGYADSLRFFIEKFPKDPRVYEAQLESAKVYALNGDLVRSAQTWALTAPDSARYAEAMLTSGGLYWQAYLKLFEAKKGDSPEAKEYLKLCLERLQLAADAPAPPPAGPDEKGPRNFNAQALALMIQILAEDAVPQPENAQKVPPVIDDFLKRFGTEQGLVPGVLLAGLKAQVFMGKPDDAEKYALTLEKDFPASDAFQSAIERMVVAYQKTHLAKANEWQKKQIGSDLTKATEPQLLSLGNRAWRNRNYDLSSKCFVELEKRYRGANPAEHRKVIEALARVYFEDAKYKEALPFFQQFYLESDKVWSDKTKQNVETRNRLLGDLQHLAECEEMGGDPKKAIELWTRLSDMVYTNPPLREFFLARYHLANSYANLNNYKAAGDVLRKVEVLYGGFGDDPEIKAKVAALKQKIK